MATKRTAKKKDPRTKPVELKAERDIYEQAMATAYEDDEEEDIAVDDADAAFDSPVYREPKLTSTDNGLPPDFSAGSEAAADVDPESAGSAHAEEDHRSSAQTGASFKQKAKAIVTRGSEELTERYGQAVGEVKVASKKMHEEMKKQPQRIAKGAAGVVGLGVVLAKRYSQHRGKNAKPIADETPES